MNETLTLVVGVALLLGACVYAKDPLVTKLTYQTFPLRRGKGNELLFSVSGIQDRMEADAFGWAINKRETMASTYRHDLGGVQVVCYAST